MNEKQQKIEQNGKEISRLFRETETLIEDLKKEGCDHCKTEPFRWEWDSGYGRQTMQNGNRCVFCRATDPWGRGNFSQPEE